jgi:VIT1/CCC1 family predicted Fe2+/Mn2+ transporter
MSLIHKYLPELVYGSIDGTVTTFAIIAGAAGAGFSPNIMLVLGVSNVLADAWSMASSNYLSAKSEAQRDGEDHSHHSALASAFATFASFVLIGCIPLVSYIGSFSFGWWQGNEFGISIVLTGIAFLFIGTMRGRVAGVSVWRAAVETVIIGAVAASVAYGVGAFVERMIR